MGLATLPNNAIFSIIGSPSPDYRYQKTEEGIWPIGYERLKNREVRSGNPITDIRRTTDVRIEKILVSPLPLVAGAEHLHDFSYFVV